MRSCRSLTQIALLAALIAVSGAMKLPSPFPGGEFQLSAPLAVAVCAVFGPRAYLLSGLIASLAGLMLGTHTAWNLLIAMQFRLVVCLVLGVFRSRPWAVAAAGPAGTLAARLTLSLLLGQAGAALVAAAVPGMIFTALVSPFLVRVLERAAAACDPV